MDFKALLYSKYTDVGRANKHGIFTAANLYIVAVDFFSLSSESGVCFIMNIIKLKVFLTIGRCQNVIEFTMTAIEIIYMSQACVFFFKIFPIITYLGDFTFAS